MDGGARLKLLVLIRTFMASAKSLLKKHYHEHEVYNDSTFFPPCHYFNCLAG